MELLNVLHAKGAKVSYPIKDLTGKQIQIFDTLKSNQYYAVLYSFAEGESSYNLTPKQLESVGQEMTVIHNVTAGLKLNYKRKDFSLESTLIEHFESLQSVFTGFQDDYTYLKRIIIQVLSKIQSQNLSEFGYGYCHCDFLPDNFHFDESGI